MVVELPSRLRSGRNVGAELQRSRLFTPASAKSNSSDDSRNKDGPLHCNLLNVELAVPLASLPSDRNGHAELQRSRLFTTASAKSNSSDDDGEYDCTLHSIFSYVVLALPPALSERAAWRQAWRPVSTAPALHGGTRPERRPQRLLTERSAPSHPAWYHLLMLLRH